MSNFLYNVAKKMAWDGTLDIDASSTVKMALIAGTAAADPDKATVSAVVAATAELSTTGYASGPGGAGRKTLTMTVSQDDTNDRADAASNSQTWTAVSASGAPHDKINKVLIYKHASGSDDTLNFPIANIDTATGLPLSLNGSDVTVAAQTLRIA